MKVDSCCIFHAAWNFFSGMAAASVMDGQSAASTTGDIMRVLAEEKSLSESAVALLNQFGKNNPAVYVCGIMLYGEAKAKFDGLIEQLKWDLQDGHRPDRSPSFQQALQHASEKRKRFLDHIIHQVAPPTANAKGLPGFSAIAELIPTVSDAAIKIWHEFRDAQIERRDEIRQQLDAQKWLPFEQLIQAGG